MATKKKTTSSKQPAPPEFALRDEFMVAVRAALSRKGYHQEDFSIAQDVEGAYVRLQIEYLFDEKFWFIAWVRAKDELGTAEKVGAISGAAAPGALLRDERFTCSDKSELLKAIGAWVQRLDAELRSIPANRAMEEQREAIAELTQKLGEHADQAFTREEAKAYADRLEELERRFEESIRATSEENNVEARLKALHQEIDTLKMQLGALNKSSWAKSAAIRLAKWLKEPSNRQLLQAGSDLAKDFLLPPGGTTGGGAS